MSLPANQKQLYFDYTNMYGERYEGYFTVKCRLTLRERHLLELEKTRLMGGHDNPTNGLLGIAVMLANLDIKIVKSPSWWSQKDNGRDIDDEDIVGMVYEKISEAELEWRNALIESTKDKVEEAQAEEASQGDESPKPTGETTQS